MPIEQPIDNIYVSIRAQTDKAWQDYQQFASRVRRASIVQTNPFAQMARNLGQMYTLMRRVGSVLTTIAAPAAIIGWKAIASAQRQILLDATGTTQAWAETRKQMDAAFRSAGRRVLTARIFGATPAEWAGGVARTVERIPTNIIQIAGGALLTSAVMRMITPLIGVLTSLMRLLSARTAITGVALGGRIASGAGIGLAGVGIGAAAARVGLTTFIAAGAVNIVWYAVRGLFYLLTGVARLIPVTPRFMSLRKLLADFSGKLLDLATKISIKYLDIRQFGLAPMLKNLAIRTPLILLLTTTLQALWQSLHAALRTDIYAISGYAKQFGDTFLDKLREIWVYMGEALVVFFDHVAQKFWDWVYNTRGTVDGILGRAYPSGERMWTTPGGNLTTDIRQAAVSQYQALLMRYPGLRKGTIGSEGWMVRREQLMQQLREIDKTIDDVLSGKVIASVEEYKHLLASRAQVEESLRRFGPTDEQFRKLGWSEAIQGQYWALVRALMNTGYSWQKATDAAQGMIGVSVRTAKYEEAMLDKQEHLEQMYREWDREWKQKIDSQKRINELSSWLTDRINDMLADTESWLRSNIYEVAAGYNKRMVSPEDLGATVMSVQTDMARMAIEYQRKTADTNEAIAKATRETADKIEEIKREIFAPVD